MPQVDIPQTEFKVVLIGDSHVGKSSLVTRFAEGYYRDSSRPPTVSATFVSKTIPTSHGVSTKVQIWDTAGSAAFRAASSTFVRGSDAVIICYDVSNRDSLAGMKVRLDEILLYRRKRRRDRDEQREQQQHFFGSGRKQQQQQQRGSRGIQGGMGDVVVAIAGLKADLISASTTNSTTASSSSSMPSSPTRRTQRQRQNTTFVSEYEVERLAETLGVLHFPTSAKTGQNVHELFTSVADRVLQSRLDEENGKEDFTYHPSEAVNYDGGRNSTNCDGEVASPRIRDKFDKYYVNETSTDEIDGGDRSEKNSSSATTMGKDGSVTTTMSLLGVGGRATPTKKTLDNNNNSEYSAGDLEETPERRRTKQSTRRETTRTKKQRKTKQKSGDESSTSSSEDEEEQGKGGAGEEDEGGGGGLCAADEPFACQSVACGGGVDEGTSCVVQ